jgi:predicted ATPase
MDQLMVENVRCFKDPISLPLAPLTLLVGENSTGKSTVLAFARIAYALAKGPVTPDFNEEPFLLGAYEQIAHYHGGQGKRANHFNVGFTFEAKNQRLKSNLKSPKGDGPNTITVRGMFVERSSQPALAQWSASAPTYQIEVVVRESETKAIFRGPRGEFESQLRVPTRSSGMHYHLLFQAFDRMRSTNGKRPNQAAMEGFMTLIDEIASQETGVIHAVAPIRSKPHRTYDLIRDVPGPEGKHVPMLLSDLAVDTKRWSLLESDLKAFGTQSGLFTRIEVKRKGAKESDPFQLHIGTGRFAFNLIDVGYGVSQVLPILVDCIQARPGSVFLLQQPEVHLHPRAQAQLGTFLSELANQRGLRFVIETHSDHLIDRVRMDVRDGRGLPAKDIGLVFFERRGSYVSAHPMTIDPQGELIGAPDGYRRFFMEEQRRFIGGGEHVRGG